MYKTKPNPRPAFNALTLREMLSSLKIEIKLTWGLVAVLCRAHQVYQTAAQFVRLWHPRALLDINRSSVPTLCTEIGLIGSSASRGHWTTKITKLPRFHNFLPGLVMTRPDNIPAIFKNYSIKSLNKSLLYKMGNFLNRKQLFIIDDLHYQLM